MDLEELLRRYGRGERDFIAINLPNLVNVNLEGINLTRSKSLYIEVLQDRGEFVPEDKVEIVIV